ncbi:MAG: hypothetical protein LBQ68_09090, partial [Clostridiales bacterium]|nr:hypothetical protein [Clostridiales bacterium]
HHRRQGFFGIRSDCAGDGQRRRIFEYAVGCLPAGKKTGGAAKPRRLSAPRTVSLPSGGKRSGDGASELCRARRTDYYQKCKGWNRIIVLDACCFFE